MTIQKLHEMEGLTQVLYLDYVKQETKYVVYDSFTC